MITEAIRVLKCMSVALIFSVLLKMFISAVLPNGFAALGDIDILALVMTVASFIVLKKTETNPLIVMLVCGAISLAVSFLK